MTYSTAQGLTKLRFLVGCPRKPTGAMQFGSDWPGLFIRGDDAMHLAFQIRMLEKRLAEHKDAGVTNAMQVLQELADLIERDVLVKKVNHTTQPSNA